MAKKTTLVICLMLIGIFLVSGYLDDDKPYFPEQTIEEQWICDEYSQYKIHTYVVKDGKTINQTYSYFTLDILEQNEKFDEIKNNIRLMGYTHFGLEEELPKCIRRCREGYCEVVN